MHIDGAFKPFILLTEDALHDLLAGEDTTGRPDERLQQTKLRGRQRNLFRPDSYLVAFEVTSILLLAAIVGAVVLAKREARA